MGLFNLFKKPEKIQDEIFGEIRLFKSKKNSGCEAESFFKPCNKVIGVIIDCDENPPTEKQKEFYISIQYNYEQIKNASIPILNKELIDWYKGQTIQNFDEEFELESIQIPIINATPINWSITYVVKKINHWATIDFSDFKPVNVLIDG